MKKLRVYVPAANVLAVVYLIPSPIAVEVKATFSDCAPM
jgi:hypothetical protein